MKLTPENYYSPEANEAYMSASFVKGMRRCEAATMAELRGEWKPPESTALLQGQFVDECLTGDFGSWVMKHPEVSKRDGNLKAEFMKCQEMVARARKDRVFMSTMEGEHQVIRTGKICGIPFKAKYDVYKQDDPDMKETIVDLKTVKDFNPVYMPGQGRVTFADAWDWPLQMAIYQQLSETKRATCLLSVISKEDPPDVNVVWIPQERLDAEMEILKTQLPRMEAVKAGVIAPNRCGKCAYCRSTHMIMHIASLDEFEDMGGTNE